MLPTITQSAPAIKAFTISPGFLMPPSAMISASIPLDSLTAENCGTPAPVISLVVQAAPGPTPTFTASAPASARSEAASSVATFPAAIGTSKLCDASRINSRNDS